jgi:hypothetical protein
MGHQNCTRYRTNGSRGLADEVEAGRRPCKSDTRPNATRHVDGLSWPAIRVDSSNSGMEPDALRPLQDWTCGQGGLPKTKASKDPVPLHSLLAEFMLCWRHKTRYSQPGDWVFASDRLKGKQPRVASMLVADYLRPAAAKAWNSFIASGRTRSPGGG